MFIALNRAQLAKAYFMSGNTRAALEEATSLAKLPGYKSLKQESKQTIQALLQFQKGDVVKAMRTMFDVATTEVSNRRQFLRSVNREYAIQHDNRVQEFEKQLLENQLQIQELQLSSQRRQQQTERWFLILMGVALVSLAMWAVTLMRSRRRFRKQAQTDALTGIANRRYFFDFIEAMVKRSRQHAASVLVLDIDHFKCINDTYGHHAGDAAIQHVAANALACLRSHDLLGRTGGEEFAAIMPETTAEQAWKIAERIRECIQQNPLRHSGHEIRLTISVGLATGALNVEAPDHLLQMADRAMYRAKHAGRNQSHRADTGSVRTPKEMTLTEDVVGEPV